MVNRKWIVSGIMTLIILLTGAGSYHFLSLQKKPVATTTEPEPQRRQVNVKQFHAAQGGPEIRIDGRLQAFEQVNFVAAVSGKLLPNKTPLKMGVRVKKGALLFEIDQTKARYNLQAMRSSFMNALTLIMPDVKVDHPEAFKAWKEYLDRFDVEHTTEPFPKVSDEKLKLFLAAKNVFQLYYNIRSAEASLEDYRIYAPFPGEIVQSGLAPGSMVSPGQLLGGMINTSLFELEATVPEADLAFIGIGDQVDLESVGSERHWTGRVARIGSRIDPVTQYVPVYIQVRGEGLKDGLFLSGAIRAEPLKGVVKIDRRLVVDGDRVYTVRDSVVHQCTLRILRSDADFVYVQGHDSSAWVVVSEISGLNPGQTVLANYETEQQ